MEQTFWQNLLNLPAGSPNLGEAFKILGQDRERQKQIKEYGGYELDNPIELLYGTANRSNDFDSIQRVRDYANQRGIYASPENRNLPELEKQYSRDFAPEVLGTQNQLSQQYTVQEPIQQPGQGVFGLPEAYSQLPEIQGREPIKDIIPEEDTIQKYVRNAKKWAATTQPDAKRYPFRQPDTVKENAEYVGRYIEAVMRLAPYFDLPPKTIASMLMEESGWGGQRFDGNLGGYGFLDSGKDMGIRFDADTIEGQAAKYLNKVASDWNGRYQGSRTPEDFHKKGYNPHKEYPGRVYGVMKMLEAN
jgi:hypothetical protein